MNYPTWCNLGDRKCNHRSARLIFDTVLRKTTSAPRENETVLAIRLRGYPTYMTRILFIKFMYVMLTTATLVCLFLAPPLVREIKNA